MCIDRTRATLPALRNQANPLGDRIGNVGEVTSAVKVRSCYHIVENDGTFWRLPKKTFARIVEPRHDEAHPEFASQRIRYAQIDVAYDGNQPVAAARATFHTLKFDDAVHLDDEDVLQQQGVVLQVLVDPDDLDHPAAERRASRRPTRNSICASDGRRPPNSASDCSPRP